MDEHTLNRRGLFLGAGAVGAVALAGVAGASPALASESGAGPAGSWLITHQDDPKGSPKTMGVASLADGGVLISHDISPAGPPGTGTWARQGEDRFKGTFWSGEPGPGGPGNPGFTVKVQVRGRVDGDKVSGNYRVWVFDPSGATESPVTGKFWGHRIEA